MPKRTGLNIDSNQLSKDLQDSIGKGRKAFYSQDVISPESDAVNTDKPASQPPTVSTANNPDSNNGENDYKRRSKHASKNAPMHTLTDARTRARIYKQIKKNVIRRSRLGGFTFRYQREELDRLDRLIAEVNKNQEVKVSKNDLVRIALNWLLEDYDENKRASVLAKVLAQIRR